MVSSMPAAGRKWRPQPAAVRVFAVTSTLSIAVALTSFPTRPAAAAVLACPPEPVAAIAAMPWAQARYDLPALAELSVGATVTVAVVDSGVDAEHPQLRGAVLDGADLLDRGGDGREDCVGHGTAVASIIAARPSGGVAFRGLAPAAIILPIRASEVVDHDGTISGDGDVADLAAGIRSATLNRPKPGVINLSISTTADSPDLRSAVAQALAADIVVVAAVGNRHDQADPTPYPAAYDGVVGVGAIGPDGLRLPMSQVGSYVDIMAPGDQITAAAAGSGHLAFQGTSFAVPFVAATAALIRARYPQFEQAEVVRRLLATADPAPGPRPSTEYGFGVLNPIRAVTEVVDPAGAGAVANPSALPGLRAANPASPGPGIPGTLLAAAVVVILALSIATVAAAVPLGRRRRWRPGRIEDAPTPFDPPRDRSAASGRRRLD